MAEIDWRKASTTVKKACINVIDSLIADNYTYLNFDLNEIKEDPDAPKSQIIMALVVKVAGGNRTIAANNVRDSLKKKLDDKQFQDVVETKGGNRLDVYLKYDKSWGVVKSTKLPVQKRIVLAIKPEGRDTGGSGGGARETKRNECAQCLYADMVFNQLGRKFSADELKLRETELGEQAWKNAYGNIEVDDAENEIIPTANVLESAWRLSHMKGANKLFTELGSPAKGTYKFYRGVKFDGSNNKPKTSLATAYSRCNDEEGKYFASEDKWNPADIWAIHKDYPLEGEGSVNEKIKGVFTVKTYNGLNAHLQAWYKVGNVHKLVGISLKKHEGTGDSNIKVINENKTEGWDTAIWKEVGSVNSNNWFLIKDKWDSSMDIYLKWGRGEYDTFQMRNFGGAGTSSWQLELKGASAAQGRCGGGVAIDSIKSNGVTFPRSKWTALTSWGVGDSGNTAIWNKCKDGHKDLPKVLDDIVNLYVKHFKNKTGVWDDDAVKNSGPAADVAKAQMRQTILEEKSQSWRYSKLLGLCFIDAIASKQNVVLSTVLRDLYLYASSQSKDSGIHWKLT